MNDDPEFNDEDIPDDDVLDTSAEVTCPYCGETVTIALDPAGGTTQEFVEDCQVCCQPWRVRVRYHGNGAAEVELHALEE